MVSTLGNSGKPKLKYCWDQWESPPQKGMELIEQFRFYCQ